MLSHCFSQGDWEKREMSDSIGRLLIFVNPNSGYMKGVKTFKEKVEPELRKKRIDFELIITDGADHAKNIVETRDDLAEFNAILILSGDGLVFEVLNGFFNRPDHWELLHVLPIGIVPSGSGNGLLSSVFASRKFPLKNPAFMNKAIDLVTSATCLAQPVNLIHAQTRDANYAAFLSVGWGLMADIDVESERWRKSLGSNRFVVGALIRCCNLRTYRGRLSYREHTLSDDSAHSPFAVFGRTAAEKLRDCTCNKPGTSRRNRSEPATNRRNEDIWLTAHSIEGIPPIDEKIPDEGWTVIEDEFVGVYAMAASHIANDGPMQPRAMLDDERIYLSFIRKRDLPSRASLIKMLIALEKGNHLKMDFLKWVDVSSFRLESLTPGKGRIVLDGETIGADSIQVTVSNYRTAIISDL
ncbi:sphk-1 [Pristionchus pacificus]|uniref:Sphk-1 n=1 Tax=Pristionchus pacificus TaxID=54126 RepID=A0A2A6B989_PRIPA|nr:sphk-1 [Pristionchus pacificus]|eukprot:PDM62431.1 sphk-1 [Pristionchus pacificus]